jgi:hypothetical protein
VLDRIDVHAPLDDVTVGSGAVWATSGPVSSALRLDHEGRVTLRIPIVSKPGTESPYPFAVATGAGSIWVLNANTGTVTKIDPAQRLVAATIPVGVERRPMRLVFGDGAAWVANADGTLARIDAMSDAVRLVPLAGALRDVAPVGDGIWVTAGSGAGSRGESPTDGARSVPHTVTPLPPSSCSPVSFETGAPPQYLIAADLPLQEEGASFVAQTARAIEVVLREHHFRAGRYTLGHQVCDDSAPGQGPSPARCAANARAYSGDASVIGVIGSWSSRCSQWRHHRRGGSRSTGSSKALRRSSG